MSETDEENLEQLMPTTKTHNPGHPELFRNRIKSIVAKLNTSGEALGLLKPTKLTQNPAHPEDCNGGIVSTCRKPETEVNRPNHEEHLKGTITSRFAELRTDSVGLDLHAPNTKNAKLKQACLLDAVDVPACTKLKTDNVSFKQAALLTSMNRTRHPKFNNDMINPVHDKLNVDVEIFVCAKACESIAESDRP